MFRVLIILLLGFAAGYGLNRIVATKNALNETARMELERIGLSELEDYYRLQKLEEKYAKADEILGKVYLILLANVGLKITSETMRQLEDSAEGRPVPPREIERAPQPSFSPPQVERPREDFTPRAERQTPPPEPSPSPRPSPAPSPTRSKSPPAPGAHPFSSISFRRQPGCEGLPAGWIASRNVEGDYRVGVEAGDSGEMTGFIHSAVPNPRRPIELAQCRKVEAGAFRRVRLTAQLKAESVTGFGGLFLRSETLNRESPGNPVRGTYDWKTVTLDGEVHPHAGALNYGITFRGSGKLWIRNVTLEDLQ